MDHTYSVVGWRWWRCNNGAGGKDERSGRSHSPFPCELSSVKSPISPPATPDKSPPHHPQKPAPRKSQDPKSTPYRNLNCTKASSCFVISRLSYRASHQLQLPIIPSLCALECSLSLHSTFCAFVCEGRRGRRGPSGARRQTYTYVGY